MCQARRRWWMARLPRFSCLIREMHHRRLTPPGLIGRSTPGRVPPSSPPLSDSLPRALTVTFTPRHYFSLLFALGRFDVIAGNFYSRQFVEPPAPIFSQRSHRDIYICPHGSI